LIDDPRTLIAGDPYEGETRFRVIGRNRLHDAREGGRTPCEADQRPHPAQEQGWMKKPFPKFDSDEELETFLDMADLDEYDLTAGALPRDEWFQRYERFVKDASIHLRLPAGLLDAVRAQAAKEKVPTQRLIREYIERGLRTGRGGPKREVRGKAR